MGSGRVVGSDERWLATLDGLDAVRARAFAAGDDRMLRSVYASADLAATDAALLHRLVPGGCGLRGVRTRYRPIAFDSRGDRATLVVTATLGASQLVCGAQVRATLPGAGPTRLRIVVVRAGSGWRIAQQRVDGG